MVLTKNNSIPTFGIFDFFSIRYTRYVLFSVYFSNPRKTYREKHKTREKEDKFEIPVNSRTTMIKVRLSIS